MLMPKIGFSQIFLVPIRPLKVCIYSTKTVLIKSSFSLEFVNSITHFFKRTNFSKTVWLKSLKIINSAHFEVGEFKRIKLKQRFLFLLKFYLKKKNFICTHYINLVEAIVRHKKLCLTCAESPRSCKHVEIKENY